MSNKEIRWKQRFENFEKAFNELKEATEKPELSKLERAGLVQTFEFTFELAWKTLKDFLESEGVTAQSPRETIQKGFSSSYISDGHLWIDALEKRNLLAHTYSEELSLKAVSLIKDSYFQILEKFHKDFTGRH